MGANEFAIIYIAGKSSGQLALTHEANIAFADVACLFFNFGRGSFPAMLESRQPAYSEREQSNEHV